jgi:RNA polymerase sigma factor (sigma-70 family)
MHLLRPTTVSPTHASLTPASVFEMKYGWLMRWALHFTRHDEGAAEDLVQDAFLRLMVYWPKLKDNVEQVEPFLYSTLRYAYLMKSRRDRRFNFQDLSPIEFDDLHLSLREEKGLDPADVQNDLRRIVMYLCWRKQSAKSASILLLRFFHGYFPDEIARIAVMKRSSVDELLRGIREEVKTHLSNPSSVEVIRQAKPPEPTPREMAEPPEQFVEHLQQVIFQARTTACLDFRQLMRPYQAEIQKPISCELLAHIVSCESCLHAVSSHMGLPPRSQGSDNGFDSFKRRSKNHSGSSSRNADDKIRRVIAGGMERFRQLYEHHPRALSIVVNGDVLATRDINSITSELQVQLAAERAQGVVEVVSEQNVPLLALYVSDLPPDAPPELTHEIELSDQRILHLALQFTAEGASINLYYRDPTLVAAAEGIVELDADEGNAFNDLHAEATGSRSDFTTRRWKTPWWRRLFERLMPMQLPEMNPMLATAMVCALAAVVFLFLSIRSFPRMKPEDILEQTTASENTASQSRAGVVVQTVRIQTPRRTLERTLYRDVQRKRRTKERKLDRDDEALRLQLETLGISWNDPLSAGSFRDWHDHAKILKDVVRQPEKGLLTLTTTTAEGSNIANETLFIREADFHPVERTIELRQAGTVEIAELNYSLLPWSSVNPDLFEPVSDIGPMRGKSMHPSLVPRAAHLLSSIELDTAELGARMVLGRLHLDTDDRIELLRQPSGIEIKGVVADEDKKRQLQGQLYTLPHVSTSLLTLQEMAVRPAAGSDVTRIQQSSVTATQVPSALDRYLTERNIDRTASSVSSQIEQLVLSSYAVKHESEQIADLLTRFASSATLSDSARITLSELLVQHKAALLDALGQENHQLTTLQLVSHPEDIPTNLAGDAESLRQVAGYNLTLCTELTSETNPSPRSTQLIAAELQGSIAQLRIIVLHISAAAQLAQPTAVTPKATNQNQ